jgi:hypothetical protein
LSGAGQLWSVRGSLRRHRHRGSWKRPLGAPDGPVRRVRGDEPLADAAGTGETPPAQRRYAAAGSSDRIFSIWVSTSSTSSPMSPASNVSLAPAARYISGRLRTAPSASASR